MRVCPVVVVVVVVVYVVYVVYENADRRPTNQAKLRFSFERNRKAPLHFESSLPYLTTP